VTHAYVLALVDALPISPSGPSATRFATVELYCPPRMPNSSDPAFLISRKRASAIVASPIAFMTKAFFAMNAIGDATMALALFLRSEEHTSELQSRGHLV